MANSLSLHPKVKALKLRSAAINYSNTSVNQNGELQVTDLDKRIVKGYLFTWGTVNDRREMFTKTAFDKSIQERGPNSKSPMPIKFLAYHNQTRPLSLFDKLEPDDVGLYFETAEIPNFTYSDDILLGLRTKVLNNFSGGFNPVWSKSEYNEETDAVVHKECELYEGSVVSLASDENARQIRSLTGIENDVEEIDNDFSSFVKSLPRPFRNQARELFARQKSLYLLQPLTDISDALEEEKPVKKRAIPYNYLINKL